MALGDILFDVIDIARSTVRGAIQGYQDARKEQAQKVKPSIDAAVAEVDAIVAQESAPPAVAVPAPVRPVASAVPAPAPSPAPSPAAVIPAPAPTAASQPAVAAQPAPAPAPTTSSAPVAGTAPGATGR